MRPLAGFAPAPVREIEPRAPDAPAPGEEPVVARPPMTCLTAVTSRDAAGLPSAVFLPGPLAQNPVHLVGDGPDGYGRQRWGQRIGRIYADGSVRLDPDYDLKGELAPGVGLVCALATNGAVLAVSVLPRRR
jgi:hypothetical protein